MNKTGGVEVKSKIFQNMVIVGTAVFALCVSVFMGALYEYFETRVYAELESEAQLAVQGVAYGGMDFLRDLQMTDRLTWVAADGTVLYDSAADASALPTLLRWKTTVAGKRSCRPCRMGREKAPIIPRSIWKKPCITLCVLRMERWFGFPAPKTRS